MMELMIVVLGLYCVMVLGGFALRIVGKILGVILLFPLVFVGAGLLLGTSALLVYGLPLLLALGLGTLAVGTVRTLIGCR